MAGAALVHSVWLTTPAENQKLARHPSTKRVGFKVVPGWADPEEPVMKGAASLPIAIVIVCGRGLEFRAAVRPDGVAGDPAGVVGG